MTLRDEFQEAVADIFTELDDVPVRVVYAVPNIDTHPISYNYFGLRAIYDTDISDEIDSGAALSGDVKLLIRSAEVDANAHLYTFAVGGYIFKINFSGVGGFFIEPVMVKSFSLDPAGALYTIIAGEVL